MKIGELPQMTEAEAVKTLEGAVEAWNGGMGAWPQMSSEDRLQAIERVVSKLLSKRTEMVNALMYEIGKNYKDAESEVDRTVKFIRESIEELRKGYHVQRTTIGSTLAYIKRAAIGVILALGPANYPLNETYAMIIPALLTGNVVVVKIPAVGGLVHLLTLEAFASELPPNTISFVSGGGRKTCPPMMKTGKVDGLAFIGGSKAADDLITSHPEPHRLKVFSQLEAKNMAIFLDDVFDDEKALDEALDASISGSLSYNGQRCTALKLLFVPSSKKEAFSSRFQEKVSNLRVGFPWVGMEDRSAASQITPLPNKKRTAYMQELIEDARGKGAKIVGGEIVGGDDSTLMIPAVVSGVKKGMKLWEEEQFGPVVAVSWYDDLDEVRMDKVEAILIFVRIFRPLTRPFYALVVALFLRQGWTLRPASVNLHNHGRLSTPGSRR